MPPHRGYSHVTNFSHIDRRSKTIVNKFFFFFELKFGALVIAYFGMIVSVIPFIIMTLAILAIGGYFFAMLFFEKNEMGSVFLSTFGAFFTMMTFILISAPCLLYFYVSYQLMMGVHSVSTPITFY